jgi:hypothetical protein
MNSWNPEGARERYDDQTLGFLTNFGGKTALNPTRVAMAFRKLVLEEDADPKDPETLQKARDPARHVVNPRIPFETLNWGCFTMMLSELGRKKEVNDLLEYADTSLNPTWENGGLFYPRNDELADEEWRLTHVEPHSGNSGIGYARLNVENGQRTMWVHPWTKDLLSQRPYIDGVGFADGVDFLRGTWDENASAMIVTLRKWTGEPQTVTFQVCNLPVGEWTTFVDGSARETASLSKAGHVSVSEVVAQEEVDIVVQRV